MVRPKTLCCVTLMLSVQCYIVIPKIPHNSCWDIITSYNRNCKTLSKHLDHVLPTMVQNFGQCFTMRVLSTNQMLFKPSNKHNHKLHLLFCYETHSLSSHRIEKFHEVIQIGINTIQSRSLFFQEGLHGLDSVLLDINFSLLDSVLQFLTLLARSLYIS